MAEWRYHCCVVPLHSVSGPGTAIWPSKHRVLGETDNANSTKKLPDVYAGATYTVLAGSGSNSTHWTASLLCKGCSSWTGGSISPANTAAPLAWVLSSKAPAKPADPASTFSIHDNKGKFTLDFTAAKAAGFADAVKPKTA